VDASNDFIRKAVDENQPIYGVTSGFGSLAHKAISKDEAVALQNNIPWFHKVGTGNRLPEEDVRAAMLIRMNSHLKGASGIRMSMIERIGVFLNEAVTPHVREFSSIGASGDLAPLAYVTACLIGLDDAWTVDYRGEELGAVQVLRELGLDRETLGPKEGLAMVNGTSFMTGAAANVVHDTRTLLALSFGAHSLLMQGLGATNQSFHPYVHALKPHAGQVISAQVMLELLAGSKLIVDELDGQHEFRGDDEPIQDRYSMRCLPQYMGPIIDGIRQIAGQVEVEVNSATDNPLVDEDRRVTYHGGNFLGQYIGVGMDQLRYQIGMLAKHLDVQIAMATTPAFSNGLPAMLVGNTERLINGGLQSLQLVGNCIMPQLQFYGNSLTQHYPPHAEGFNQNINSQGFGSANLARRSVELFQHYIAVSLLFGLQVADLRTKLLLGHYDASLGLSGETLPLYSAVREVIGRAPDRARALVWNDDEQQLDAWIDAITGDIRAGGLIAEAVAGIRRSL
ncbi:MAG TPA: aromatic amino acid ammonia-lyase, partial [Gammaproteobacteria bacterium]|nr:aromatic amino acid ammonia-lyase [Gammaproteobacteria bacterium]